MSIKTQHSPCGRWDANDSEQVACRLWRALATGKIMEMVIDVGSKIIAFGALIIGAWWGVIKFLRRDEHFPRVGFEVSANFVGIHDGKVLLEVLAHLENKGVVPLKIKDLNFKVRGLAADDPIEEGDSSIRGQIRIPHMLWEGSWVPEHWHYTFIYPGVKTEYNYVAALPTNILFVRVEGSFSYDREGSSHHAAKLQRVPNRANPVDDEKLRD